MKTKTFLREYSDKVYSEEQKREESLITQSGRMITAQGLSLTVFGFLPTIFKDASNNPIINTKPILFLTLISILFSVLVQLRFPKLRLTSIKKTEEETKKHPSVTEIPDDLVDKVFFEKTKEVEKCLRTINNFRSCLVTISMITYVVGLIILVINISSLL